MSADDFDAVVIGGGPAGSTAAAVLARAGWRVAVVEKAAFPRRKVCGEFLSATSIAVLDRLGVGALWRDAAGPEVRRLALFHGEAIVEAPMPAAEGNGGFGRALGRARLDAILLDAARAAGAALFQPCRAVAIEGEGEGSRVDVEGENGVRSLRAPVVVAAHGSWEPGPLPTHLPKSGRADDHFGFKAYFAGARLAPDLMPLLVFPGGYGGMVTAEAGRLSISCCLRRDALARAREATGARTAAEALHRHLLASCRGIREALDGASLDGTWLSAGPIRPGIRAAYADDIFRAGNLAGESHPIIAEGIAMAIQSGWLLGTALGAPGASASPAGRLDAASRYGTLWRAQFSGRIRAASLFTRIGAAGPAARLAAAGIRRMPRILTLGASLAGKAKPLPAMA